MRISDWSSDVCSSDLLAPSRGEPTVRRRLPRLRRARLRRPRPRCRLAPCGARRDRQGDPRHGGTAGSRREGRGDYRRRRCANASRREAVRGRRQGSWRSEEHTSELQSLMRISYAVFCLKKKNNNKISQNIITNIQTYLTMTTSHIKYSIQIE